MWNKVNDIKQSNFLALQSYLVDTIATTKMSVVNITISKDVKFYVDDPAQLDGPGSISQQTTKLWWWSGIMVSKKWYVLTNKHVVQDTSAKYSVSLFDGTIYNVDKIWFDDLLDIAILKIVDAKSEIPNNLYAARLLPFDTQVDVGQFVFSIGNALAKYPYTVTMGILWWKNKEFTINERNLYIWLYQTDAQVNPGNSGGPLVDINWYTLWILTAIAEWEGMSFALPLSQEFIDSTITSIESFGKIIRPIMGIQYVEITPTLKTEKNITIDNGIYVTDVLTDLPAWEAGLKKWDIITHINKKPINNEIPFLYQLYIYMPGETIDLTGIRDSLPIHISIVLWWNTQ